MKKFYTFYNYVILRDSMNQFLVIAPNSNVLEKVIVHVSFKPNFFKLSKVLAYSLFILEYLTNQKAYFAFSKKDVSIWRLRKTQLVSIYCTLHKHTIFFFLEKFLFTFMPKLKHFSFVELSSRTAVTVQIRNFMLFSELERESINMTKQNAFFKNYTVSVIFIFSSKNVVDVPPTFFLNQFQYSTTAKK
jgi:ribosomal protein L5